MKNLVLVVVLCLVNALLRVTPYTSVFGLPLYLLLLILFYRSRVDSRVSYVLILVPPVPAAIWIATFLIYN